MLVEKKNTAELLPADYNRKDLKPTDKEYEKLKRSIELAGYVAYYLDKTTGRCWWSPALEGSHRYGHDRSGLRCGGAFREKEKR